MNMSNLWIEEVNTPALEWYFECERDYGDKWLALEDLWFKVERQFGQDTEVGVKVANEVCQAVMVIVELSDERV